MAAFLATFATDRRAGVAALSHRLVLLTAPAWRFVAYALSLVLFLLLALLIGVVAKSALPLVAD